MVARHTVTLANSIVGVSVLAMPFCFKQCGIVLATLSLMIGAVMTRMVCYFLLKAAVMSRRRTYEMLAWSTFGQTGKFMVEISIIGFLIGTLIAFMVVIGDLGPEILSEMFSVENNSSLRTIIMTALSLFVALPLGLLRNIDSLSSVSTASVLFYLFLVIKIFSEGIGPLWSGEYLEKIHFWRSGGVLQCIPIFSMALSCQTQVFGIYDALPEPSLQKMNEIVKQAVNICTFFYFCVGFFGYIAFHQQNFGGNILMSFSPAWTTQLIKSMFLMSVVFSVPLVVFPCRASLHSMIFKSGTTYHQVHDMSTNYIPESRLKFLTVTIVGFTLVIGILIPNIELVLGLVGSTTGSVICIIFPSIMFVRVTSKNTTERLLAQGMFIFGVVLMLLTTYATLYAAEQSQIAEKIQDVRATENAVLKPALRHDDVQLNSPISKVDEAKIEQRIKQAEFHKKVSENKKGDAEPVKRKLRVEKIPPSPPAKIKLTSDTNQLPPKVDPVQELPKSPGSNIVAESSNQAKENIDIVPARKEEPKDQQLLLKEEVPSKDVVVEKEPNIDSKKEFVDKQVAEEFLKKLEEHQENQKKLLEEQKEILEELKQHHAQDVREKIEKEKKTTKDKDAIKSEDAGNAQLGDVNKIDKVGGNQDAVSTADAGSRQTADKLMREQAKIIAKISANIEKENKNVQLLEKLEEGLNKKVQILDGDKNENTLPKEDKEKGIETKQEDTKKVREPQHDSFANVEAMKPQSVIQNQPISNGSNVGSVKIEKSDLIDSLNSRPLDKGKSETRNNDETVQSKSKSDMNDNQIRHEPVNTIVDTAKSSPKAVDGDASHKEEPGMPMREKEKIVVPQDFGKGPNKVEVAPLEKKTVSEKIPKEKIDREI